jgi:hypothetical protein
LRRKILWCELQSFGLLVQRIQASVASAHVSSYAERLRPNRNVNSCTAARYSPWSTCGGTATGWETYEVQRYAAAALPKSIYPIYVLRMILVKLQDQPGRG